jgi:hypothetical protein
MCARGAGPSTSSLDQQRESPPLSRASGRIATPPFTPVLSESHQVNHRYAASERRRNRTCTPAFTPVLGPSDGARFVDAELDMGMMRSIRRVKRDSPDFIALRAEDGHEDSHEHKEAINIESIIHAEAAAACAAGLRPLRPPPTRPAAWEASVGGVRVPPGPGASFCIERRKEKRVPRALAPYMEMHGTRTISISRDSSKTEVRGAAECGAVRAATGHGAHR